MQEKEEKEKRVVYDRRRFLRWTNGDRAAGENVIWKMKYGVIDENKGVSVDFITLFIGQKNYTN